MFKDLKGIKKGREEKERNDTALKYLLGAYEGIIAHHFDPDKHRIPKQYLELYETVYHQMKESLPDFNEDDLTNFVLEKADGRYHPKAAKILGLYSGCLLHILAERNNEKDKKTCIYIDGKNKKFDHLFNLARKVDCLILENFKGECVGSYVGTYKGKAGVVIGKNIEGDTALENLGSDEGCIDLAMGINIKGGTALTWIGGDNGHADLIYAKNIEGRYALLRVGTVPGYTRRLLHENVRGQRKLQNVDAIRNISKEEKPEEYAENLKKYQITEILELLEQDDKTGIAEKVYSIYQSIKPLLEK